MNRYLGDLHVHSLLSPCAEVEMTPHHILLQARQRGLQLLAITDHNACDNVPAALKVGKELGITVLPGMEAESKEEAHFIVLFPGMRHLHSWEELVAKRRQPLKNDEDKFGVQLVVDERDDFVAVKEEMLLGPLDLPAAELVAEVHAREGLVLAAHVDRPAYSLLSQIGFIPPDLPLDGVELSRRCQDPAAKALELGIPPALTVITSSDSHTIEDFLCGPATAFYMREPTFEELRLALHNQDGRRTELLR